METIWFINVTFMFAMYAILDGFDLGAGMLHLFIAKIDSERRTILNAIGPLWDGNEVWLLAAGGVLYFSFPIAYASLLSGFYIPLILVLWLLMFRALGIELRHQSQKAGWTKIWDFAFGVASIFLAFLFGVAVGNVLRGFPLTKEGYFSLPLIASFIGSEYPGAFDWFTIIFGLLSVSTLTVHGAHYLAYKTEGEIRARAVIIAERGWFVTIMLLATVSVSLVFVRPTIYSNFVRFSWGNIFPFGVLLSFVTAMLFTKYRNLKFAFMSSSAFILFIFFSLAFCLYPILLPSLSPDVPSITIENAAAQPYGLTVGLAWWIFGTVLVVGYFFYIYRVFRGPVKLSEHEDY